MSRRIPAGAALVLVLSLSACGSSSGSTGVATASTTSAAEAKDGSTSAAAPSAAAASASGLAYAQCMRKHGIDMPDPSKQKLQLQSGGGAPPKVDQRKVTAAMAACKSLLPSGAQLAKPPADAVASMRKLAKCMRANGITTFPDPGADGQMIIDKSSGIDLAGPAFKAAQAKCSKYAPTGGQLPGPGPVSGGK